MKNLSYNMGYFVKEVKTIIKINLLSNIFSVFSTALIFFILAMVISGWRVSNQIVEVLQGESEINIYLDEELSHNSASQLLDKIHNMIGVKEARVVEENEAYGRMVEILGKEARILEFFDDNPFSPYIEVKLHLDEIEPVIDKLNLEKGIEHIRDNRDILDRIHDIDRILRYLGYLGIVAVGISTLVIISHIITMGIYNNKDQINTLRLLGASESFIAFPFLLVGLVLTLGGGVIATGLAGFVIKQIYIQMAGPLPFIPLPPLDTLLSSLTLVIISLSAILGFIGSLWGLSSAKEK